MGLTEYVQSWKQMQRKLMPMMSTFQQSLPRQLKLKQQSRPHRMQTRIGAT